MLSTLTALAFVLVVLPATAFADTTWTGATDTDWNDDTNWTDGQPDNADTAFINNTSANNPEVSSAGEVAGAVQLSGDKQLNITGGDLDVVGQITAPAGTNVNLTGGGLEFGTILVDNASGFTMAGGFLTGTLTASSPVTLVNNGTNYAQANGESVTLGNNVNVNQTADITMGENVTLNIGTHLYTLSGTDITVTGGLGDPTATITIASGGRLLHTGVVGGEVQPQINSDGVVEDSGAGTSLNFSPGPPFNANQLGGTVRTSGGGTVILDTDGGDSWTVKAGGFSVDNPGGTVQIQGSSGDDFNLNGQTISLVNGNLTHAAAINIAGTGSINRVAPNGGEFLIDAGEYAAGANVTITNGTTARVVGSSSWDNTFNLNVNGTLVLDGTIVTAPNAGTTPQVNISSTGVLRHIGGNAGLFEPRVVSNGGTIEDDGTGSLDLNRAPAQVNLYSGTIRTLQADADVQLGTEVHRLQGATTFDTSQGGEIRTVASADLQLNGQTLTLIGPNALWHEDGATISGTGTINGPGTMRIINGGGDFAGGGTMNINAPVVQTSTSNVGGFGSELRIGGDWLADGDITSSETATVRVVSGGTLRHSSGTNTVSAPLTIDNGATVDVDGGQLQLTDLSNYSGTTLTGGAYDIASASSLCIDGVLEELAADLQIAGSGQLLYAPAGCATNAITNELATIASGGSFTLVDGHIADIDSSLTVNGELAGNGVIIGSVINNGDVSPGTGIGELDIDGGNYTQGAGGDLNIEVSGTGAGQFDILDVDGDVFLDGELAMLPIGGFPASAEGGDRVPFLRYSGSRSGTFDNVSTNPALDLGQPFFDDYDDPGQRVFAVVGNTFKPRDFVARRNRNNGTATLIVRVTGSGLLQLFGPEVKSRERTADGPGKVNLPVKTRKGTDARRELNREGKTTVKVTVRYIPDIGNPSKRKIKIQLIDRD